MQLHQLKPTSKSKTRKRVGRGGKRGTFSGRGSKGQKARAGHRIRPGFRGGDNPIWKLFPKQRGASKKTDRKHAFFRVHQAKPAVVNLADLAEHFQAGEIITSRSLVKKGLIKTAKKGVKILGGGALNKALHLRALPLSQAAQAAIMKAGGKVE